MRKFEEVFAVNVRCKSNGFSKALKVTIVCEALGEVIKSEPAIRGLGRADGGWCFLVEDVIMPHSYCAGFCDGMLDHFPEHLAKNVFIIIQVRLEGIKQGSLTDSISVSFMIHHGYDNSNISLGGSLLKAVRESTYTFSASMCLSSVTNGKLKFINHVYFLVRLMVLSVSLKIIQQNLYKYH